MEVRQQVIGAFERDYTAYDANGNLTAFTDLRTAANDDPDGDGQTFTLNLRFPGQYFDTETGLR